MKVLVLMCGIQCSGKTEFIKNHQLERYTISPDDIRKMYFGTTTTPDGVESIAYNFSKESKMWDIIHDIVRNRLEDGQFTVIDCMNVKLRSFRPFLQIAKDTRSRVYVVDMMQKASLEECLKRNHEREFNPIPDDVVVAAYKNYQKLSWPRGVEVISPDDFEEKVYIKPQIIDRDVAVIGDIHGCYDTLMKGLEMLPEGCLKVFVGDYCDRGPQNVEMINWLIEHRDDEDKIFLTGNHEAHLLKYSHDKPAGSKEFNLVTAKQFDEAKVDKKGIRQFCSRLRQMCWFRFLCTHDLFINHGGISTMGKNPVFIPTHDLVHGTGKYEEMKTVAETWCRNSIDQWRYLAQFQVHGHRNIDGASFFESLLCINLEDSVEKGGSLRMVLFKNDCRRTIKTFSVPSQVVEDKAKDVEDLVKQLRSSENIKEKQFGDVSSFNFTRKAFYGRVWDRLTQKARELYINTKSNEIVARGFDKFFNIGERPNTSLVELAYKVKYPVTAYQKENGFLGLVGFDHTSNGPIITSKSDLNGPYAGYVKENLLAKVGEDELNKIIEFVKENNCTLALEVCDKERDPHIIEYPESDVFLLAVIYNDLDFKQMSFEEIQKVAKDLGLNCKKLAAVINNEKEWFEFFEKDHGEIEGYVLEDSTGYMVKYKTPYYNYWKHKRSLLGGTKSKIDAEDAHFVEWFSHSGLPSNTNIIEVRKAWEAKGE